MASLRDQILEAIAAELDAVAGLTASQRGARETGDVEVRVLVFDAEERKQIVWDQYWDCALRVVAEVAVQIEDASAVTHGSNAYRYLDEQMTLVEASWQTIRTALIPGGARAVAGFDDVLLAGTKKFDPSPDLNEVAGHVFFDVHYRHDVADPSAFTQTFP